MCRFARLHGATTTSRGSANPSHSSSPQSRITGSSSSSIAPMSVSCASATSSRALARNSQGRGSPARVTAPERRRAPGAATRGPEVRGQRATHTRCKLTVAPQQLRGVGSLPGSGVERHLDRLLGAAVLHHDRVVLAVEKGQPELPAVELEEPMRRQPESRRDLGQRRRRLAQNREALGVVAAARPSALASRSTSRSRATASSCTLISLHPSPGPPSSTRRSEPSRGRRPSSFPPGDADDGQTERRLP
jgi:hypothetical protein